MKQKRSVLARLNDIEEHTGWARQFIAGKSFEEYHANKTLRMALERATEIISEASKHIPESEKRKYPEIAWRSIASIGNVLRHEYERVAPEIIWSAATTEFENLERIIGLMKVDLLTGVPTRIDRRFAALKSEGRAALVTFITAGDPDMKTAAEILAGLPAAGADVIEIGMPFSDPMADGPAIQASSLRALRAGHKMVDTLKLVRDFRKTNEETPIVLMGYYNPIFVRGPENFVDEAVTAGVDGLIIVDVPPEADDELCLPAVRKGLNFIRLATPTTDSKRLPAVLENSSGFVYYVSITGITGTKAPDIAAVHKEVKRIKGNTKLPVCVGFGVKTPQQAKEIASGADGVVVGSVLTQAIADSLTGGKPGPDTVKSVINLVKSLSQALRAS